MLLPILRLYAAAGLRHFIKGTRSFDKLHSSGEKISSKNIRIDHRVAGEGGEVLGLTIC